VSKWHPSWQQSATGVPLQLVLLMCLLLLLLLYQCHLLAQLLLLLCYELLQLLLPNGSAALHSM
jgi:hypothetical protein